VVKQTQFIDEKPDPQEQKIAREQLQQMVHYAECAACRRAELLRYFGEERAAENCEGCDNCLSPRATFDGTLSAQKFLSCVYRIREKNGFGVGLNHVVEVLTGADTEKIRKWGHTQLSTYGIGKEHGRPEWSMIGRELVRLGFLRQTADKFSVLELTQAGGDALKQRTRITLTKPAVTPQAQAHHVGEITCDEPLFERLRALRKTMADERDVPAYIIFSDVALRQMARNYPGNEREFARISGVGEKKLREFGGIFLGEIAAHLQTNARQMFADDSFTAPAAPPPSRSSLGDSARETMRRFRAGQEVEDIARERKVTTGTILGHIHEGVQAGEAVELSRFFTDTEQKKVAAAFERNGPANLTAVFESLGGTVDYGKLRIFRALMLQ
jgi:ATP-dependent DNA helicase RecQ